MSLFCRIFLNKKILHWKKEVKDARRRGTIRCPICTLPGQVPGLRNLYFHYPIMDPPPALQMKHISHQSSTHQQALLVPGSKKETLKTLHTEYVHMSTGKHNNPVPDDQPPPISNEGETPNWMQMISLCEVYCCSLLHKLYQLSSSPRESTVTACVSKRLAEHHI